MQIGTPEPTKRCIRCGETLPLDAFGRTSKGAGDGRRNTCRACVAAQHRAGYLRRGRTDPVGQRQCGRTGCGAFLTPANTRTNEARHYCSRACLLAALGLPADFDWDALPAGGAEAAADAVTRRLLALHAAGSGNGR